MEFVDTNFKEDFPFLLSSLMGSCNANDFQALDNPSHDLSKNNYPYKNPFSSQHNHGHVHGLGDGHHADDNHHHEVFPTDLNYDPPYIVPENGAPSDYYHRGHDHRGHRGNGDEHMLALDQILTFHDLNMMPEDEDGSGAAPVANMVEKEEKVVEVQPVEEPAQETNPTHTKTSIVKGQWSPKEDRLLVQLVRRYGDKKWSQIAEKLDGRVGKQCRERWHNHLRPDIKKGEWSMTEDIILIEAHKELGNKWSRISKRLPGRTENTIKNHWNATMRKLLLRRTRPGGSSNGTGGSTLLRDYIMSLIPPSLLAKGNNNNDKKYSRRNNNSAYNGRKEIAADDNRKMNLNLDQLPPSDGHGERLGPYGCGIRYLLFGHVQTDNAGMSEENRDAMRKEMDLLEMISHSRG